jgi:hypothetical protein
MLPLSEIETRFLGYPVPDLVSILTELSRLLNLVILEQ